MKKLVVVVDAQYDFFDYPGSKLPISGSSVIVPRIREYLKSLTSKDTDMVLFTADEHDLVNYLASEEGKEFPPHCIKGDLGQTLVVDSRFVDYEIQWAHLVKDEFSMWSKTAGVLYNDGKFLLDSFLIYGYMGNPKETEVVVCGVALNYCVKWAVDGFVERGYNVTVMQDLTMGIGEGPEAQDARVVFADYIRQGSVTVK